MKKDDSLKKESELSEEEQKKINGGFLGKIKSTSNDFESVLAQR